MKTHATAHTYYTPSSSPPSFHKKDCLSPLAVFFDGFAIFYLIFQAGQRFGSAVSIGFARFYRLYCRFQFSKRGNGFTKKRLYVISHKAFDSKNKRYFSLHRHRLCQVAGFVGVVAALAGYEVSQQLQGDHREERRKEVVDRGQADEVVADGLSA